MNVQNFRYIRKLTCLWCANSSNAMINSIQPKFGMWKLQCKWPFSIHTLESLLIRYILKRRSKLKVFSFGRSSWETYGHQAIVIIKLWVRTIELSISIIIHIRLKSADCLINNDQTSNSIVTPYIFVIIKHLLYLEIYNLKLWVRQLLNYQWIVYYPYST